MTSQANLGLKNYTLGNTKLFAINLMAIAALITAASTLMIGERGVDAQENHGGDLAGNMTSSLQQHEQKTINNGTINLEEVIFQAINSRINTSLTQAMTTAERSVGNDSFAVAAFGSEEGGYFAYRIILATPGMKFYYVKVDPGNGEILETQQVSQKELDKMHKEHSAMVVSNNGNEGRVSGFPFIIPH
jgi:Peptidase propeptide and YPEB domain